MNSDQYILGISAYYHDSAAAIIKEENSEIKIFAITAGCIAILSTDNENIFDEIFQIPFNFEYLKKMIKETVF